MMLEGAHERQGNRCTLDHMMPLSRGGADRWDNVVACCNTCNGRKGDMTAVEYMVAMGLTLRSGVTFPTLRSGVHFAQVSEY